MWLNEIYAKLNSRQCWQVVSLVGDMRGGGGGANRTAEPRFKVPLYKSAQIPSSENVLKRDAILAPVAKQ